MKKICCIILILTVSVFGQSVAHKEDLFPTETMTQKKVETSSPEPQENKEHNNTTQPQKKQSRQLNVKHNITQDMLKYKHWSGTYEPEFNLQVNGYNFTHDQTIITEDEILTVEYSYSFMNGYRKGRNKVTYRVPDTIETCTLQFSWHDKQHVIVHGAHLVTVENL